MAKRTTSSTSDRALDREPKGELAIANSPAVPATITGTGVVQAGARPRRRGCATGEVPLRTFIRAAAEKDDQLVGFKAWISKTNHTKHTMSRWRELLAEFQTLPVG